MFPTSRALAAAASGVALALAVVTWRDYRQWRSLGEGGVPANALGYLIVTVLRIVKREPFSIRPYEKLWGQPYNRSWIAGLPQRQGSRPSIDPHPIPQRQVDQHGASIMVDKTMQLFDSVVAANDGLKYAPSGFETRHDAITLVEPYPYPNHEVARRAKGEVAHVHPTDGSMHMIFSPADATKVLSAGWGERHALAGLGPLPLTYLMVYAARSDDDLGVVSRLLDASVSYMSP